MISDDLVNSYHLLLCALDLVYGNALQCSNRKELVNPNFKGKFIDSPCRNMTWFSLTGMDEVLLGSDSMSIREPERMECTY